MLVSAAVRSLVAGLCPLSLSTVRLMQTTSFAPFVLMTHLSWSRSWRLVLPLELGRFLVWP